MPGTVEITIFLLCVNAVPALLGFVIPEIGAQPLDGNARFRDGFALFGSHKTIRGVAGGIFTGGVAAHLIGVSALAGLTAGLLSMIGDVLSSFIKRRMVLSEGSHAPLLDQCFETGFPLLFFHWAYAMPWVRMVECGLFFFAIDQTASIFLQKMLIPPPAGELTRLVRSSARLRVWRACHATSSTLARYLNFENVIYYHWFMKNTFKIVGIYERGRHNALDVRLQHLHFSCPGLPAVFDPFQILFIADLHIDGLDGLDDRLISLVSSLQVDVCLLGGDYRMEMYGPFFKVMHRLRRIIRHIQASEGIFGILGNHDCISTIPDLEDCGICMLVNDAFKLEKNGEQLWLVGVDDPHYYKCHDLKMAFRDVPQGAFSILMSHSPEIMKSSAGYKIDLCLCGHTHGGQIRLPVIGPVFTHIQMPRRFAGGMWSYDATIGYTSSGAGASGVPVRFNCPPEVALITLSR
ncbi:MAG: CDP-archaeol synthase [Desulfobacterales bacterium]|nr:CDP-archaeol synthase [Desulfobacterales bacterium]MDD4391960.1 CDP-archaeol synthase [Desulfobacterales bacterium]